MPCEDGGLGGGETEGNLIGGQFGAVEFGRTGFEGDGACDGGGDFEAEFGFGGEGVGGCVWERRGCHG